MEQSAEMSCRGLLARIWADDCFGDYSNYRKCVHTIKHFKREHALALLRTLIREYQIQMDEWAYLSGESFFTAGEYSETAGSIELICDLHYIGNRIPAYALLREGRTKEAERLMKWLKKNESRYTCHARTGDV